MIPRDWNATSYARIGAPVHAMGEVLLDRLALRGDETVLDAGCGSGEVTAKLLERLPRGRVIAVDGSEAMVSEARARLPRDRAETLCADLCELRLPEPVDAVFSSATFHWIGDHETLFARLAAAARPGAPLLAQCGGAGNVAETVAALDAVTAREPFAAHVGGLQPWNFAAPAVTVQRLENAGFTDAQAGLHEVPVTPDEPAEYFRTIMLGSHLERLPADLHDAFVEAVLAALPPRPTIIYVRLTMSARRAG